MEGLTRRDLAKLAVLCGAATVSEATSAATMPISLDSVAMMPDSPDALAKLKGFSGFGSSMGAGATASEGGSLSFNDAGVRAIQRRERHPGLRDRDEVGGFKAQSQGVHILSGRSHGGLGA
jgi:hypothetical protein